MSVSKRSFQLVAWVSVVLFLLAGIACNNNGTESGSGSIDLRGAGATFPNPLYQKWLSEYGKVHPNVKIDYQLVDFLWWGLHDGEGFAKELQYAPLPADIVKQAEAKINSVTSNGTALR